MRVDDSANISGAETGFHRTPKSHSGEPKLAFSGTLNFLLKAGRAKFVELCSIGRLSQHEKAGLIARAIAQLTSIQAVSMHIQNSISSSCE
jgi:hypothetical protein